MPSALPQSRSAKLAFSRSTDTRCKLHVGERGRVSVISEMVGKEDEGRDGRVVEAALRSDDLLYALEVSGSEGHSRVVSCGESGGGGK